MKICCAECHTPVITIDIDTQSNQKERKLGEKIKYFCSEAHKKVHLARGKIGDIYSFNGA